MITITLSDNESFKVRRLGIFELDDITPNPLPPITYIVEMYGATKDIEVEFKMSAYETPPIKPTGEIVKDSVEWYDMQNYNLYQACILREKDQNKQLEKFYKDVQYYILNNCANDDINRLVESEDWQKVYEAALVPQLTIDIIAETLHKTYQAKFNGENVFDAAEKLKRSNGSYNTIRLWEIQLMTDMKMTELEYSMLPIDERSRKVCAKFLPDIMSSLQMDYDRDG